MAKFFNALLFLLLIGFLPDAAAQQLASYKDDLFALPATLSERDGGAFTIVDYNSKIAINQRDAVLEKKARKEYVSLEPLKYQKDRRIKTPGGAVRHYTIGTTEGASIIVFYIHGHRGNRHQGVDDWTFGGNFNRLKNLMVMNNGLYICPDFKGFTSGGGNQIAGLIEHYTALSPNAKVFIAAGSAGGNIIYQMSRRDSLVPKIGGFLFLGSFPSSRYFSSPAFKARVPVYIGHGSRDTLSLVENLEGFYRGFRERSSDYPLRMVRFETGTHGTPIRMTDWRETLNWMLRNQ